MPPTFSPSLARGRVFSLLAYLARLQGSGSLAAPLPLGDSSLSSQRVSFEEVSLIPHPQLFPQCPELLFSAGREPPNGCDLACGDVCALAGSCYRHPSVVSGTALGNLSGSRHVFK